jgi:hypothetical protein
MLLSPSSPPDRPQHWRWYVTNCHRVKLWRGDEVTDITAGSAGSYLDPVAMLISSAKA